MCNKQETKYKIFVSYSSIIYTEIIVSFIRVSSPWIHQNLLMVKVEVKLGVTLLKETQQLTPGTVQFVNDMLAG